MIKWFADNKLVQNVDKTNIIEFIINNSLHAALHIAC